MTKKVVVNSIHFTQDSVGFRFRHGRFRGRALGDVIDMLERRIVDVDDFDLHVFVHDGDVFAFDNRTLFVLKEARVPEVDAILWYRPRNYETRIGFGRRITMRGD